MRAGTCWHCGIPDRTLAHHDGLCGECSTARARVRDLEGIIIVYALDRVPPDRDEDEQRVSLRLMEQAARELVEARAAWEARCAWPGVPAAGGGR